MWGSSGEKPAATFLLQPYKQSPSILVTQLGLGTRFGSVTLLIPSEAISFESRDRNSWVHEMLRGGSPRGWRPAGVPRNCRSEGCAAQCFVALDWEKNKECSAGCPNPWAANITSSNQEEEPGSIPRPSPPSSPLLQGYKARSQPRRATSLAHGAAGRSGPTSMPPAAC